MNCGTYNNCFLFQNINQLNFYSDSIKCKKNEYKCNSGKCITLYFRCDGHKDCRKLCINDLVIVLEYSFFIKLTVMTKLTVKIQLAVKETIVVIQLVNVFH